MIDDLKMNWRLLPDQWKATLRTAWQTFLGVVVLQVLALLDVLLSLVQGEPGIDLRAELVDAGRIITGAAIVTSAGVITFLQNRSGRGAAYPPPPPR